MALDKCEEVLQFVCQQVLLSRKKDYDNEIRNSTFRNMEERDAVNGRLEDNSFIIQIKKETEDFMRYLDFTREKIKK